MELKLFTDLVDAVGIAAEGLKAIINLPTVERETLDDLPPLPIALNTVIIQFDHTLLHTTDDNFSARIRATEQLQRVNAAGRVFQLCDWERARDLNGHNLFTSVHNLHQPHRFRC